MKSVHIHKPLDVSLIEPRAYSDKNILELIKILGDPNNQLSLEEMESLIADFVVKYLMMYLLNLEPNQVMPLEHVNMFYGWMCAWSRCMRENKDKWKFKMKYSWKVDYFFRSFNDVPLSANMISDVASTTAIFREIIMTQVHPMVHMKWWKYIGLDLGTGSGIWCIAMHIQALRNRCKWITTIGIDNHRPSVKRTTHTLEKIKIPAVVVVADTTEIWADRLSFSGIQPAYICNETIPIEWAPFYAKWAPSEPFFHNHHALKRFFGNSLYHFSLHFPHRVDVIISDGWNRTKPVTVERSNFFHSDFLWEGKQELWMFIEPQNIQLSSTSPLIRLAAVGDELRQKTWDPHNSRRIIPANPDARFRWALPQHLDEKF
jgi:hypothetical protein